MVGRKSSCLVNLVDFFSILDLVFRSVDVVQGWIIESCKSGVHLLLFVIFYLVCSRLSISQHVKIIVGILNPQQIFLRLQLATELLQMNYPVLAEYKHGKQERRESLFTSLI